MNKDVSKMLKKHRQLIHSENQKVESHVQRGKDGWYLNTVMIADVDVPFRYKRKTLYKSLKGGYVNMTYYRDVEALAGFDMDVMRVVRIKRS